MGFTLCMFCNMIPVSVKHNLLDYLAFNVCKGFLWKKKKKAFPILILNKSDVITWLFVYFVKLY